MSTANFHDRVDRLNAKYAANPSPKPEIAPHIDDVEAQLAKGNKPGKKPGHGPLMRVFLVLFLFTGLVLTIAAGGMLFLTL